MNLPLYNAVKINNPTAIIPINLENPKNDDIQFWNGDEKQNELLSSFGYFLVEIEDRSKLQRQENFKYIINDNTCGICAEFLNSTEIEEKLEFSSIAENPKILIPHEIGIHIGYSRLTDLGIVTQRNRVHTFIVRKLLKKEYNPKYVTFEMDDANFGVEIISNNQIKYTDLDTDTDDLHIEYEFKSRESTMKIVFKILKRPFFVLLNNKSTLFMMFICRMIFGYICKNFYDELPNSSYKTVAISWFKRLRNNGFRNMIPNYGRNYYKIKKKEKMKWKLF
ncbi:hypothetical protein PGB90_010181 [Kerria lacca]